MKQRPGRASDQANLAREGAAGRLGAANRPEDPDPALGEEIRRIAAFAPCDPLRLVELYREVAALSAFQGDPRATTESGFLMAARDRQPLPRDDEGDD